MMQPEVKGLGGRVGRQGDLQVSRHGAWSPWSPSWVTPLFSASRNALLYGSSCSWAIPMDSVPMHFYSISTVSAELIPIKWEFWTIAMMPHELMQVFLFFFVFPPLPSCGILIHCQSWSSVLWRCIKIPSGQTETSFTLTDSGCAA